MNWDADTVNSLTLAAVPFVGVVLGLVYRTFVPFLIERYKVAQETGEYPKFERKFWVPPVATLVIEGLLFVGLAFASPGTLESIAAMGFVAAVAFGMAGQSAIRDVQKFLEARSKK